MKESRNAFTDDGALPKFISIPKNIDYVYTSDKVISQRKDASGFAPVTKLLVTRTTYRKDGSLAKMPWCIKIMNGRAKLKVGDNGATTFDKSTLTDQKEAFINLSDREMFRMMTRITHFITLWENAQLSTMIKGAQMRKSEEEQRSLNYGTNQQNR